MDANNGRFMALITTSNSRLPPYSEPGDADLHHVVCPSNVNCLPRSKQRLESPYDPSWSFDPGFSPDLLVKNSAAVVDHACKALVRQVWKLQRKRMQLIVPYYTLFFVNISLSYCTLIPCFIITLEPFRSTEVSMSTGNNQGTQYLQ